MDFARRQLEKYGWSDGKGLGKNENGISEALKPKLKRSVTGVGHDPAAEFNEHWWTALYDKAAKNVEVEDKNGKTKKIKTIDNSDFKITNNTWRLNKKTKEDDSENGYSEYFIRKAVLTNGGIKVENIGESESEDEMKEKKDVFKMTDEELFAACEGRTAHKGARHGLKATGKLARIAKQEQMLLSQEKYEGYSHAKKHRQKPDVIEDTSIETVVDDDSKRKKKKKRKRCFSNEIKNMEIDNSESVTAIEMKTCIESPTEVKINQDLDCSSSEQPLTTKKSKKKRKPESEPENVIVNVENSEEVLELPKKKKKKKCKSDL